MQAEPDTDSNVLPAQTNIQASNKLSPTALPSAQIPSDWGSFTQTDQPVFTTQDWNAYAFADGSTAAFSIQLPPEWSIEDAIIRNEGGDKVGEFTPGPVKLSEGQQCFDIPFDSEETWCQSHL